MATSHLLVRLLMASPSVTASCSWGSERLLCRLHQGPVDVALDSQIWACCFFTELAIGHPRT